MRRFCTFLHSIYHFEAKAFNFYSIRQIILPFCLKKFGIPRFLFFRNLKKHIFRRIMQEVIHTLHRFFHRESFCILIGKFDNFRVPCCFLTFFTTMKQQYAYCCVYSFTSLMKFPTCEKMQEHTSAPAFIIYSASPRMDFVA